MVPLARTLTFNNNLVAMCEVGAPIFFEDILGDSCSIIGNGVRRVLDNVSKLWNRVKSVLN